MNIGELFLNLGIKGTEKTVSSLGNVKKSMGELGSTSLEAKAAIVGAMYALERMFASSNAQGAALTNFNATLGVSAKTLQQYQYAARQVGVSNQEVEGSFRGLQSAITKTLMGEGAPKGLARLSMVTGDMTPADLLKMQKNPELLLQKLQEYAKREQNIGLRNETLKSFGLGDQMIAALSRGAFRQDVLNRAPIYSDRELGSLDKANAAWSNLANKIEMAVGKFNARHGLQLVNDISKITDAVLKLAEAFLKLAEKLKIFEVIGTVFKGWTMIFDSLGKSADKITKDKEGPWKGFLKENKDFLHGLAQAGEGAAISLKESIAPGTTGLSVGGGKTQNISVNQNLNFQHDGKDHKRTAQSVHEAVRNSYRQLSAQGQGS